MAKYKDTILTAKGLEFATKAANGGFKFTLTKVETTATGLSGKSEDELKAMTALPDVVSTGSIVGQADDKKDQGIVGTEVQITNIGLEKSYTLNGLALWAKAEGEDTEYLYAIAVAEKDHGEYIPDFNDKVTLTFGVTIYVIVGDTDQVTVQFDPAGLATIEFVENAVANAKPDIYPFTAADGSAKVVIKSGENMPERLKELSKTAGSGTLWVEKGVTSSTSPDVSVGSYTCDGKELYAILGTAYRAYSIFATADSCKVVKLFAEADLTDRLNGLKQAILDQASENAKAIAEKAIQDELDARNAPKHWWYGTQADFDKIDPKDADTDYSIYEEG